MNKPARNFILDVLLFAIFILTFLLDVTGVFLHQWLGILCALIIVIHLGGHLRWFQEVTRNFLHNPSKRTITYYVIDATILLGFVAILISGLIISTWLELPIANYLKMADFHVAVSVITLALVVLKIGLHWKWIAQRMGRKAKAVLVPSPAPVPVSQGIDRRRFLTLMGAVGFASYVALRSALSQSAFPSTGLADLEADDQPPVAQVATSQSAQATQGFDPTSPNPSSLALPTPTLQAPQAPPPASCVVRCPNHCSYPGQCRRYVDFNRNNLCDNGECL
jgi:energy-converting hydrogenase Eha subunit A